eukprot:4590925-Pyramimonas_sp.AAC.1
MSPVKSSIALMALHGGTPRARLPETDGNINLETPVAQEHPAMTVPFAEICSLALAPHLARRGDL